MQKQDGTIHELTEEEEHGLREMLNDDQNSPDEVTVGGTRFFRLNRHERRKRAAQRRKRG